MKLIFVLKGIPYQITKKNSISEINVTCSNTDLFSLYYEPWYIQDPNMSITVAYSEP